MIGLELIFVFFSEILGRVFFFLNIVVYDS